MSRPIAVALLAAGVVMALCQVDASAADPGLEIELSEAPSNQGAVTIRETITNRYDQRGPHPALDPA